MRPKHCKCLLILLTTLQLWLVGNSQRVSFSIKNGTLKDVFGYIEKQTNYHFTFVEDDLYTAKDVTLTVTNAEVEDVLRECFKNKPVNFTIKKDAIILQREDSPNPNDVKPPQLFISGKVVNDRDEPITGATIISGDGKNMTFTNNRGEFKLTAPSEIRTLHLSSIGYESKQVVVASRSDMLIQMKAAIVGLDESLVIGYGKTSRRLNTGAVTKITAEEIGTQPIQNTLAAMEDLVPGLLITQTKGFPGSAFKIQLRGQMSIGTQPGSIPDDIPLFIIDGVPYAVNNQSFQNSSSGSALGSLGRSPLASINPGDIESIEVLKDADATAIYGSRGAAGVVLITTRKAKIGKPVIHLHTTEGVSTITHITKMMDTKQYVAMRKEALQNDGLVPNISNAPDLVAWDTTRYTDFSHMLIGGHAWSTDAQASISGGSEVLQYLLNTAYYRETTVMPGNFNDQRYSAYLRLDHNSSKKKLAISLTGFFTNDNNKSLQSDITNGILTLPNAPSLHDVNGNLAWQENGVSFNNPLANLLQTYQSKINNLLMNLQVNYHIHKNIKLIFNGGANLIRTNETALTPIKSLSPNAPIQTGSSIFATTTYKSWILEPQAEYNAHLWRGKLNILVGGSWQELSNDYNNLIASGYTDDKLITNKDSAPNKVSTLLNSLYRYESLFGRVNYNLFDRYIINITGRRDGSSRFGPSNKFANFAAIGGAWIFSDEAFIKKMHLNFISFGKLRSSYGSTGNDQIGDYKYLDNWQQSPYSYLGNRGLIPSQLADSNYQWEVSRKLDLAIELGLFQERIHISVDYFREITSHLLIASPLPVVTGFTNVPAFNSDAQVENKGFEISLQTRNITNKDFTWTSKLLLTVPKNKLLAFPNLAVTRYSTIFKVGESLTIQQGLHYLGVDPQTGLYTVQDIDRNGKLEFPMDYINAGNLDPKFYGGLQNRMIVKKWQIDVFLSFRKEKASSLLNSVYFQSLPGSGNSNEPTILNYHWRNPSDVASIQKLTTLPSSPAAATANNYLASDARLVDASYLRLRNVSLSYSLSERWLRKLSLSQARIYLESQNLFTITSYKGPDPETQSYITLPPLRTFAIGLDMNF